MNLAKKLCKMMNDLKVEIFGIKEEILGRSTVMELEKRAKKIRKLFAKASTSMYFEPVKIVSDDEEEKKKVEPKVSQSEEEEKVHKSYDEVTNDDKLIEEKVLEMIRNPGGVKAIGDSYHNMFLMSTMSLGKCL